MCTFRHWAPTCAVIVLAAACSSTKSQGVRDAAEEAGRGASEDAREANRVGDSRTADTAETQIDQARSPDVVDAAGGHDVVVDVRDVGGERDATGNLREAGTMDTLSLRDTSGGEGGGEVGDAANAAGSRDGADAQDSAEDTRDGPALHDLGKPIGGPDTAAVRDTSTDLAQLDAAPDVPPPNSCVNAIEIPMDKSHVDLALTTRGQSHKFDLPCAQGGPDLVLQFSLLDHELVYADTFGANWNTILHISKTCPPGSTITNPTAGLTACSDDACSTSQSQATALLPNYRYYLYLSGANGESGDVTVHFQHAPVGTGPASPLAAGTGSVSGATVDGDSPPDIACEYPGPSSSYWWITCPDYLGGTLAASTCTGTNFDTALSLQVPRTDLVSCADDTDPCGSLTSLQATIPPGAGLNLLTLGGGQLGPNGFGPYLLTYTRP